VTPRYSAPPSGETVSDSPNFSRFKNVLEVLYHRAKFSGGSDIARRWGTKNVEFLFVCPSCSWITKFMRTTYPEGFGT